MPSAPCGRVSHLRTGLFSNFSSWVFLNFYSTSCPVRTFLRRLRISLFDVLRRLRVFPPLASFPVGETGCLPPERLPSPPPIGCATGFIAEPRTLGRRPR